MDITAVSKGILVKNRATYSRQLPSEHAAQRIAAIDEELARRATRKGHRGKTAGYVLTATGQFEHLAGDREGFTKCGVAIDPNRSYGSREWWHCLSCGS
jgi:hypothetical protein